MAKNVVTLNLDNTDYSFRPYGTCSTGASTVAKTVSITGFTLCNGATILVKFSNSNTIVNPTLNVNGTGAKPILHLGHRFDPNIYYEFIYDGSNWVQIGEGKYRCSLSSGNKNNYPWHRIAYTDVLTTAYTRRAVSLILNQAVFGGRYGELVIKVGTNSANTNSSYEAYWIVNKGFGADDIKIGVNNTYGNTYFDVFYKCPSAWSDLLIEQKTGGGDSDFTKSFTLCSSKEVSNTTTTDKLTSHECYATIESAATELHNTAYTAIISPNTSSGTLGTIKFNGAANRVNNALTVKNGDTEFTYNGSEAKTLNITDKNVEQTATSGDAKYPLLLASPGQSASVTGKSYFDSGVTLNPSTNILDGAKVYESLLRWGNTTIQNGLSPIDAAMDGQWSSNRLSFMPASGINIEYSTDGGTTWTDYDATDDQKCSLVTTGLSYSLSPGKNTTRQKINSDRVRVTITAEYGKTYFSLKKIYMYISQNGASGCKVLIEKSQCGSDTTFTQVGEYIITGWPGWNSIPLTANFGGSDGQTTNIRKLRFTYYFTTYGTGYGETDDKSAVKWTISKLNMIGETSWSNYGGNLPTTGHIYSYDINKNTTFPANLTISGKATINNGLILKGDAASKPLITKAVIGSDGKGEIGPLYIQYGVNQQIHLGSAGTHTISADGGQYSGKSSDSDKLGGQLPSYYATAADYVKKSDIETATATEITNLFN